MPAKGDRPAGSCSGRAPARASPGPSDGSASAQSMVTAQTAASLRLRPGGRRRPAPPRPWGRGDRRPECTSDRCFLSYGWSSALSPPGSAAITAGPSAAAPRPGRSRWRSSRVPSTTRAWTRRSTAPCRSPASSRRRPIRDLVPEPDTPDDERATPKPDPQPRGGNPQSKGATPAVQLRRSGHTRLAPRICLTLRSTPVHRIPSYELPQPTARSSPSAYLTAAVCAPLQTRTDYEAWGGAEPDAAVPARCRLTSSWPSCRPSCG